GERARRVDDGAVDEQDRRPRVLRAVPASRHVEEKARRRRLALAERFFHLGHLAAARWDERLASEERRAVLPELDALPLLGARDLERLLREVVGGARDTRGCEHERERDPHPHHLPPGAWKITTEPSFAAH